MSGLLHAARKEFAIYEFLPVTDRMWEMRQAVRDRTIFYDSKNARLITEADKLYGPMIPYLKHGKMMRYCL